MEKSYCIRTCFPDEEGRFLYLRDFSEDFDDEWTFWGSDDEPLFFPTAAHVDRAVWLITMNCIERGEHPYRLVILERNQALATWAAVPTSTPN